MDLTTDLPTVRIIVVGDSGVGKTSFLQAICQESLAKNVPKTTGCNLYVKLPEILLHVSSVHEHVAHNVTEPFFLEFLDIGGHQSSAIARSVFYPEAHGVILAYDLSNRRSYLNLRKWIGELSSYLNSDPSRISDVGPETRIPSSGSALGRVPALIVGLKKDLVNSRHRRFNPLDDYRIEAIDFDPSALSKTGLDDYALSIFFDRVIANFKSITTSGLGDNREARAHSGNLSSTLVDRRGLSTLGTRASSTPLHRWDEAPQSSGAYSLPLYATQKSSATSSKTSPLSMMTSTLQAVMKPFKGSDSVKRH